MRKTKYYHSKNPEFKIIMEECAKNSIPEEGLFDDIKFDLDEGIIHTSKSSFQRRLQTLDFYILIRIFYEEFIHFRREFICRT